MLKGSKKTKIVITSKIKEEALLWLKISDMLQKNNLSILFNEIFIDQQNYTVEELSQTTSYSERNIFRQIDFFLKLIEIISQIMNDKIYFITKSDKKEWQLLSVFSYFWLLIIKLGGHKNEEKRDTKKSEKREKGKEEVWVLKGWKIINFI